MDPNQPPLYAECLHQANHRRQSPESVSILFQTTQLAVLPFERRAVAPEDSLHLYFYEVSRPCSLPQPDSIPTHHLPLETDGQMDG